jgi:hypothetical protein
VRLPDPVRRTLPVVALGFLALGAGCRERAAAITERSPLAPFSDEAASRGLGFQHATGAGEALNIYQTSGGGCGLLDYDGDGYLDVFLVQGQHRPGPGGGNRLYRNRGDGTFEDVTDRAGVRGHGYGMGCAAGDFDEDGWIDLYLCNRGRNELYRNRGDGTFEDVSARTHADVDGCSVGAVFADLDGDGRPDLFVNRYVRLGPTTPNICRMNDVPTSCGPQQYVPLPGVFLHNLGGKDFRDDTKSSGLANDGRGMATAVLPMPEGRLSLLITNDTTANNLFVPSGKGRYRNDALGAGVAYGDMGHAEGNMGCDWGDYDGDGDLDLFIGAMQHRMDLLYGCDAPGAFSLATRASGLGEPTLNVTTYGCGFLDYDLDGLLDLFLANGHVQNRVAEIEPGVNFPQPCQLFRNQGAGVFQDVTASGGSALTEPAPGRGAAFGDIDNDGDVDVLVNNLDGRPRLLVNHAERLGRHWLRVKLEGKKPNTQAEGALVELPVAGKTLVRHAHAAYSYASTNDARVNFGLGGATSAGPLRIRWPGGGTQTAPVSGVDREMVVKQQ